MTAAEALRVAPEASSRSHALHEGVEASESAVLEWCRDKMAGYKRPRSISFVAEREMPRTATGKIQHRVLRERLASKG